MSVHVPFPRTAVAEAGATLGADVLDLRVHIPATKQEIINGSLSLSLKHKKTVFG